MSDGDQACFFILWVIIVASTFLSTACTWGFSQKYDESENAAYSGVAALLSSIALCGCTLGLCGWPLGHGGSETKMCMGILWQCFNSFDGDNEISMCIKLLAGCGLGIVIIPSFGILQVVSGGLMVKSLVINTAVNVKVFAGFIAILDFIAASSGMFVVCALCAACEDEPSY